MVIPPQVVLADAMGWEGPVGGRGVPDVAECGWCRRVGPVGSPIPSGFTQWSQVGVSPSEPWLCVSCGGALVGLKPVRWGHALATADGVGAMSSDPRDLLAWLSAPVLEDRCVMVQANRQKRSVLASAWGVVATTHDVSGLRWGDRDVATLAMWDELRWVHGVSEREIEEAAPRHQTLARSPDPAALLGLWAGVKAWDPVRMEVGKLATRRTEV